MSSRSPSSSPDILGPSGDADYLISSPFIPFSGRQSFMSPANFRLQSPRTAKGKRRSRISLSPSKNAHSIKFNDVVLPASPTMKLNGQQSGMPLDTVQPDGNVSPWRIRVTLEATQDEDTNQGSPVRKRSKPSTTTMKVPLKDDTEQTPRKRRGRPRKSDTLVQDATPRAGSPGHTPGPGGTGQKRKRGRPRKSQPLDVADQGQQSVEHQEIEQEAPIVEPEQRWSPLNLAADMGSDDDIPGDQGLDFDTTAAHEGQMEQPDMAVYGRSSPRVTFEPTFDTPNVDNVDQGFTENDEYNLNSTPSKMPSPTRDSQIISPTNTLHAGRTPRQPRIYPTPTSSSVADEEKTEQARKTNATHTTNRRESGLYPTIDPTEEHTEFDSIMESEGFSMVSLDTLPSAKQHELKITSHQQAAKSALKPFLERESNGVLKRRASAINQDYQEHTSNRKAQLDSRSGNQLLAQISPHFGGVDSYMDRPSSESRLDSAKNVSEIPLAVPESTSARQERGPLARLVRIVRAGFALEGPLRNSGEEQISRLSGSGVPGLLSDRDSLLNASRKRLELLFGDFAPEVQKELRAGLAFGQELAKRRRQSDMERRIQTGVGEASARNMVRGNREASGSRSPQQMLDEATHYDTPGTFMRRRMEEWQREREVISREIQMANSSQVIVLDSDDNDQSNVQDDRYEVGDEPEYESESIPDEDAHVEAERLDDEDEDDGYEDIWQQEAHSQGNHSDHSSLHEDDYADTHPGQDESSPWKAGWTPARNQNGRIISPAHWTNEQEKVPFLGRSRVKQLQEQEVDLTSLYRSQNTPKRNHYYYGKSSPLNSTIRGSVRRSSVSSVQQEIYEHVSDQDRQSESYVESSPRRDSDDETFQIDPTTRLEIARQRHEPGMEDDEIEGMSDAAAAEGQPPSETGDITPERPGHASPDNQASSWFQKITNFTPGWLRAPNTDQQGPASEKTSGDEENDESPTVKPTHDRGGQNDEVNWVHLDETPRPLQFGEPEDEQQSFLSSESFPVVDDVHASLDEGEGKREEKAEAQTPGDQSVSSVPLYFSNDHYRLLHHLYRSAKLYPERFPYHPAPGRSDMIGDWIWTSDGVYGVPVTELQFAIIDRFAQQLSQADMKAGGTGQINWTEADVHRRLISIIIGEQIRQERKQRLHEDRLRVEHSRNRDAAYETWRI
ncbi:AT DNA binding protein [Aspergillus sclerotioniger CBS 115572]|uniref:AT DNA binding protein n=1 Tax=Aspergillus sclerotioniger CBS 115572 TaxID=1450535 RepID=A0A317W2Y1_9EURO|nr:AT DNA binding protein [Aspergillus sclerotioniger CBS 115572]PWY80365.1 AT DNA binding protein [Aspergillus sclerotioniger CBS 115572]